MLIGIPREPQTLVSATPDTVGKLIKLGYDVAVQSGAGDQANFPDSQYEAAGATIVGEDVLVLRHRDDSRYAVPRAARCPEVRVDPDLPYGTGSQ